MNSSTVSINNYKLLTADFALNFIANLQDKPFVSNCFHDDGLFAIPKLKAIKYKHIQVNSRGLVKYLLFDLDHNNVFCWQDAGLPEPSWQTINPLNGHSHIAYALKAPVCIAAKGRNKPITFLEDIRLKFCSALQADIYYQGLTTKNPLHPYWNILIGSRHDYELGELAEFCYRYKKAIKPKRHEVLGSRNCDLFSYQRTWAYANVSKYSDAWIFREAVLNHLMVNNTYKPPLPYNEVKAMAKSIASWTWQNFQRNNKKLRQRQSERGIKSGQVRSEHIYHCGFIAFTLTRCLQQTQKESAKDLRTTEKTLRNWIEYYLNANNKR